MSNDCRRKYFNEWLESQGISLDPTKQDPNVIKALWDAYVAGFNDGVTCHANGEWY